MAYKDKAKERATHASYRASHKAKICASSAAYRASHKVEVRARRVALKIKEKGGISNVGPCFVCGWDKTPNDRHRLKFGGAYVHENVILLCPNHHRLAHQEARK
jgi:hypothetical protein